MNGVELNGCRATEVGDGGVSVFGLSEQSPIGVFFPDIFKVMLKNQTSSRGDMGCQEGEPFLLMERTVSFDVRWVRKDQSEERFLGRSGQKYFHRLGEHRSFERTMNQIIANRRSA